MTEDQLDGAGKRYGPPLQVLCGPLLNYQHMAGNGEATVWHGSVLIVTQPDTSKTTPKLELKALGPTSDSSKSGGGGVFPRGPKTQLVEGLKLYSDPGKTFWRFAVEVPLAEAETAWQYTIPNVAFLSKVSTSPSREFVVPSVHESFRIMFHSCNGFSVGTDEEFWSGPALWNDVLRVHKKRPFHVMIGGGDQIYNDSVRVKGPLKAWTEIGNPIKRERYPFDEQLRQECDLYYFENYVRWYSTEPFAAANASIPQVNIWDDHDIIDGFGSYTDRFMHCPVFRGLGGVSFKYYCLFQHHTAPPRSTFTTDAPSTMHASADGTTGIDPRQTKDTYVHERTADDLSWIVGKRAGPYVEERSRSIYCRLGKRIAFCGIDARTERTRKQVNYPETYDLIFERLQREITASRGEIKHLILLLGVPIAYPRLAWLENILSSPLIAPIRLLNKRFGIAGGLFNHFDGSVDLLDDLDDHYTARHHKKERRELVLRLQRLSRQFSMRITILGGDVHLGALGRFYSATEDIDSQQDYRYMANIISSAITNKPPPKAVANLLARRNKIHHLKDGDTDETLFKLFDKQPGGILKGAEWNMCTMPSRNYAVITEIPGERETTPGLVNGNPTSATTNGHGEATNGVAAEEHMAYEAGRGDADTGLEGNKHRAFKRTDGHSPLHRGEEGTGTTHPFADGVTSSAALRGGLDVVLRVEIDNSDHQGKTEGYALSSKFYNTPLLFLDKGGPAIVFFVCFGGDVWMHADVCGMDSSAACG